jgi:predicted nucleic acid-binding protein
MAKEKIYIDTCCFIEVIKHKFGIEHQSNIAVEDIENEMWHLGKVLEASKNGDIDVITSTLTIAECTKARESSEQSEEVRRLIKSILTSRTVLKLADTTPNIGERARDLHWTDGLNLKGADAVHVATALNTGCTEFFTFDFRRKTSPFAFKKELHLLGLHIKFPSETTLLPSDYRQDILKELPQT